MFDAGLKSIKYRADSFFYGAFGKAGRGPAEGRAKSAHCHKIGLLT